MTTFEAIQATLLKGRIIHFYPINNEETRITITDLDRTLKCEVDIRLKEIWSDQQDKYLASTIELLNFKLDKA